MSINYRKVQKIAKGRMKTTPHVSKGRIRATSKERTSKVIYMNELLVPEVMPFSRKIEWATEFKLKNERYASENFQVMNYGLSGKITAHVDTAGLVYGKNFTKPELGNNLLTLTKYSPVTYSKQGEKA